MTAAAERGASASLAAPEAATRIPRTHPRYESLVVRERLAAGLAGGVVAEEGLIAHGRGEAFDYLIGEETGPWARDAAAAAAAALLLAERPVVSVNGNTAALCAGEAVRLAEAAGAALEVNLFYGAPERRALVAAELERAGAARVLGADPGAAARLHGLDSARRTVDREGILAADVVLVALEDGDRAEALRAAGKTVIAVDLNPLSRTARAADIPIVDNVTRAAPLLAAECRRMSGLPRDALGAVLAGFDGARCLDASMRRMRDVLGSGAGPGAGPRGRQEQGAGP